MLNFVAKMFNKSAKPNSKTHIQKVEAAKEKTVERVKCEECGRYDVTLYKHNGKYGKYYCKEHLPEQAE